MRRKTILFLLLALVVASQLPAAGGEQYFNKGIAYILINDVNLAKQNLDLYFRTNPSQLLRNGFMLLVDGDKAEAINGFRNYLNMNLRSPAALVGIALATADMRVSNTMELLMRAIRLKPSFSTAYLCLGVEYLKKGNYPMARRNFEKAISFARVPEYKILLSRLHLELGNSQLVINLLKSEVIEMPDNFYFNQLLAASYFKLDNLRQGRKHIDAARKLKPSDKGAKLLMAKYMVGLNQLKKARILLKELEYGDNDDYIKTTAQVLLKLRDPKVGEYLYKFFAREKWDKDINSFMAEYYQWKKGRGNVQSWISRAILSGANPALLKKDFPGEYKFPEYPYISFFNMGKITWVSENIVLLAGVRNSGERENLYVLDTQKMRIIRTLSYKGKFQDIFFSPDRTHFIISTVVNENESINLYSLKVTRNNFRFKPLFNRPQVMPGVVVGFDKTGSQAYITNILLHKLGFESPFAIVSVLGKKTPLYPNFPFPVYQYNFDTGRLMELSEPEQVKQSPIRAVRQYLLMSDAFQLNESVRELVKMGQSLNITSNEVVRTYFGRNLSSFILYLSDLQNAFQAIIYNSTNNKIKRIDETMFLGKGNYAELKILDFNPYKKEILVLTKDSKELIKFNYDTFLFNRLADQVVDVLRNKEENIIYVLSKRNKKTYFTETTLEIISLDPFLVEKIKARKDLSHIISYEEDSRVHFSTYNGELLEMDGEYNFKYLGPYFEGALHRKSPSKKQHAAFINGRLYIIR